MNSFQNSTNERGEIINYVDKLDVVPKVSVIMSVYNTRETLLREAVDSVLTQTFADLEFIIIDDGSNEKTKRALRSYSDDRIRLYENENNIGLTRSLNKAIGISRGKYIARMDSDDVSHPDRIKKQYEYLERHKDVNILGTNVYDKNRHLKHYYNAPQKILKAIFVLENAGPAHPSIMIRKSFLDTTGIMYDEEYTKAQDYDLFFRCIDYTRFYALTDRLVRYRENDDQISTKQASEQTRCADRVRVRAIQKIDKSLDSNRIENFVAARLNGSMNYSEYCDTIRELLVRNKITKVYDELWLKYTMIWYILKYIKGGLKGRVRMMELLKIVISPYIFVLIYCEIVLFYYRYKVVD